MRTSTDVHTTHTQSIHTTLSCPDIRLASEGAVQKVLLVDLDAHQGNVGGWGYNRYDEKHDCVSVGSKRDRGSCTACTVLYTPSQGVERGRRQHPGTRAACCPPPSPPSQPPPYTHPLRAWSATRPGGATQTSLSWTHTTPPCSQETRTPSPRPTYRCAAPRVRERASVSNHMVGNHMHSIGPQAPRPPRSTADKPNCSQTQVELGPYTNDDEYLSRLDAALDEAAARCPDPHLVVFNAGGRAGGASANSLGRVGAWRLVSEPRGASQPSPLCPFCMSRLSTKNRSTHRPRHRHSGGRPARPPERHRRRRHREVTRRAACRRVRPLFHPRLRSQLSGWCIFSQRRGLSMLAPAP